MTELEKWLAERRRIHAAASKGPWEAEHEEGNIISPTQGNVVEVFSWIEADATAIADAHNHLPAFIRGWEAVLRLHQPVEVEPSDTICGGCSNRLPNGRYMPIVEFPCPTVRALEAVIGDE